MIAQESAIAAAESALAQVSAHVAQRDRLRESPRPRAIEIPEDAVYSGELFRQVPDFQLAGPPEQLRSNFINGIKHLPVDVGS